MYQPVRLAGGIVPAMDSTDTRDQNPSGMDGEGGGEAPLPAADHILHEHPHSGDAATAYGHLALRDTRTPEEQLAASMKEYARRKGRGRSKWWEKGGE